MDTLHKQENTYYFRYIAYTKIPKNPNLKEKKGNIYKQEKHRKTKGKRDGLGGTHNVLQPSSKLPGPNIWSVKRH